MAEQNLRRRERQSSVIMLEGKPWVPCDEAAVEHATKRLWLSGWDKETARELVVKVLQAAGETR